MGSNEIMDPVRKVVLAPEINATEYVEKKRGHKATVTGQGSHGERAVHNVNKRYTNPHYFLYITINIKFWKIQGSTTTK